MKTMKMKLLQAPVVIAVVSALVTVGQATPNTPPAATASWTTTGLYGLDLTGKMFTLSSNGGGVSFYPPHYTPSPAPWASTTPSTTRPYPTPTTRPYPAPSTRPYPAPSTTRPYPTPTTRPYPAPSTTRPYPTPTTRPYPTPTTRSYPAPSTTRSYPTPTYPPWTTASATRGVSVCLRYLIEQTSNSRIFILSPSSRSPLLLSGDNFGYRLSFDRYSFYNLHFRPNIWFWSNIGTDIWTRVCLTVDSMKNVAQVFSSSSISIRKMLPVSYVWSGEPVIDFSGFDGQLTDVQVWDYPLRYTEVFNYMTNSYWSYRGSALTWSSISYSSTGNTLLEDTYEWQAKQPISSRGRGRRPKGERKKFFNLWEKERKRQL